MMNDYVTCNGIMYKTNDIVTCTIINNIITEAKLYVSGEERFHNFRGVPIYLCQNEYEGAGSPNKLGYKYSYVFNYYLSRNEFPIHLHIKKLNTDFASGILELAYPMRR